MDNFYQQQPQQTPVCTSSASRPSDSNTRCGSEQLDPTQLTDLVSMFIANHDFSSIEYRCFSKALRILLGQDRYLHTMKNTYRNRLVRAYMREISKVCVNRFSAQIGLTIEHKLNVGDYSSIIDLVADKLSALSTTVSWKSLLASLALCVSNVWYNFDRPATVLMSISQFILTLKLKENIMQEAMEWFKSIYDQLYVIMVEFKAKLTKFVPDKLRKQDPYLGGAITYDVNSETMRFSTQSGYSTVYEGTSYAEDLINAVDVKRFLPYLSSISAVLLSLGVLRAMPKGDNLDTSLNRFSKISSILKSTQDVARFGGDIITACIDQLAWMIFGIERTHMDEWKNINEWNSEVCSLMVPDFESTIKGNECMKQQVESLLQRGLNIVRTLDMLKVPMVERQHVTQSVMFLMRARETAGNCGAGQTKPRVAPAIIHIFGNSGVGKSTVLWALIAEIQASLGVTKASDLHEKTYFRRPGGKYWDGYNNGMNVVVCDDFGAMRDSESAPNEEFLEAIHMSNTAFWQLNMAELSEKRSTFFQAKCVLWTSNKSKFAVKSLTNPEAVLRRVDLKLRQRPKPEFSKDDIQNGVSVSILDTTKVNEAIKARGQQAMLDCVTFDIIDKNSANDDVIEGDLDFWDVAEKCVNITQRSINHFEDFNTVLEEHVSDAIARCAAGKWTRGKFTMQMKLQPSLWNYVGYNYQHCNLIERKSEANIIDVSLGDMTDEEYDAIKLVWYPDCLFLEQSQHQMMLDCYHSALSAWDYLPGEQKTKEAFANLFVQATRKLSPHTIIKITDDMICADHSITLKKRFELAQTYIKEQHNKMMHAVETRFALSPRTFYAIAGVVSAVVGLVGYKIYQKLFNSLNKIQKESYDTNKTKALIRSRIEASSYSEKTNGRVNKHTLESYTEKPNGRQQKARIEGNPSMSAQAVTDQNAAEVVDVLYKNMYKLECFENGQWDHCLNILIIKGRLAIVNRHIMIKRNINQWRIRNSSFPDGIEFNLMKCAFSKVDDYESSPFAKRDVMMIELPRIVHQHKDISSKFMTSDDFSRFNTLSQISVIGYIPNSNVSVRQYFGSDVMAVDSEFEVDDGKDNVLFNVRRVFKYNIQTTPGDCGAVLVAFDKNFSNKIFGIHCGGTVAPRWTGFGCPVSRSFLDELERRIDPLFEECRMSPEISASDDQLPLEFQTNSDGSRTWLAMLPFIGNFYHLGKDSTRIHANTKTRINASPVYGIIQEPTMAPAKLKPFVKDGVTVDPMERARAKASPLSKPVDRVILESCAQDFLQMIEVPTDDNKILSYEESISGIEGDDCYPPMKRSTSPGYGWDKKGKGKTAWMGSDEYDYSNPELRAAYDSLLMKCIAGKRPSTIWSDTLKDERRTLDKVAAGKTRLFSCGEMAFTVLFRQYFAGYIAHMTRNKIDFESCVGTNVYSMDWTYLVNTLQEVGDKVLAGDFSNYDGTLHSELLWECLDVINAWYKGTEEEERIRRALWSEIVNSIHIVDNVFYMWNHSQPSGCPMTTILNCTYHSLSARYVYILCAKKYAPTMTLLSHFHKNVRHLNYGDDDLWCISSRIIEWFNQVTITEAYLDLGMTYTDEAKTGNVVEYRTLGEVNFLKRKFRYDSIQQRWRAPLALETIREMPMWIHGNVDTYQLTAENLQSAVRELAQHERSVFDAELPAFEEARKIVNAKYPCRFATYEAYQEDEFAKL